MLGMVAYAQPAVGPKMKATTGLRIVRGASDAALHGWMRTSGEAASAITAAIRAMSSMTGLRIVRSAGSARLYDKMRIDGTVANARPAVKRETSSTIGLEIAKGVPGAESSGRMLTGTGRDVCCLRQDRICIRGVRRRNRR